VSNVFCVPTMFEHKGMGWETESTNGRDINCNHNNIAIYGYHRLSLITYKILNIITINEFSTSPHLTRQRGKECGLCV